MTLHHPVPPGRLDDLPEMADGLTAAEAASRRARFGPNAIVETPPGGRWHVLRDTARDPMIWFLVGVGALFAAIGDYEEALILAAAILPLVGMDAWLHRRTQASTQGLRSRLAAQATVIRDAAIVEISAVDLVPGDLAIVRAGETFPADGLIVAGAELQAEESVLTGEAFPMRKLPLAISPRRAGPAIETSHWGFAGTRLLTGRASVRIVATGAETLYGEIVRSARAGAHALTPLQRAIAQLVTMLVVAAAAICVLLAAVRLYQGHGPLDALLSAATLAVAAIPEEFPVVFAFFLGVGVYRLAQRRALVRRAVVVENIGRVSCICSDKTGTLTEGQLRLVHRFPAAGLSDRQLLRLAALAARRESNDPLDLATLSACDDMRTTERLALFPFTEDRRREAAAYRGQAGKLRVVAKGAPEVILARCTIDPAQERSWHDRIRELSATAHKVIACAWRDIDAASWSGEEPDHGYAFAGLLAFEDPVRQGVADAVRAAREAGIRVIMVTGDHPDTALAVAREIGIGDDEPVVIEGRDLEQALARAGAALPPRLDVVARAVPAQKLILVQALQAAGEIVAVTGDGVNDVPALQAADIGIAMGERGTRSAREVGAIVLLDDNFRTIVNAIAEGRQLFTNLRHSFAYLLMVHIPLVLSAALIPLAGFPLLYLPIHVVWLELIIHPTALLSFQAPSRTDGLVRVTRTRTRFFGARDWIAIGTVGSLITMALVFGYAYALGAMHDVEHARAMALLALITGAAVSAAGLNGLQTRAARAVAAATIGSAVLLIQVEPIAALLHLRPLHGDDWLLAAMTGILAAAPAFVFRFETPDRRAARGRR